MRIFGSSRRTTHSIIYSKKDSLILWAYPTGIIIVSRAVPLGRIWFRDWWNHITIILILLLEGSEISKYRNAEDTMASQLSFLHSSYSLWMYSCSLNWNWFNLQNHQPLVWIRHRWFESTSMPSMEGISCSWIRPAELVPRCVQEVKSLLLDTAIESLPIMANQPDCYRIVPYWKRELHSANRTIGRLSKHLCHHDICRSTQLLYAFIS